MKIENCKDLFEENILIPEPLYDWYLQQGLSLEHNSKKRSHFCLLHLLNMYISDQLEAHRKDKSSFVLSDTFKDSLVCNSSSFNSLLTKYFDLSIESCRVGKKIYAAGYKLKDKYLNEIHNAIYKYFELEESYAYIDINANRYEDTILYKTKDGIVDTKAKALKIEIISRRQESKINAIRCNILKKKRVSNKQIFKTDFHIPRGYYKIPVEISLDNLIYHIKDNKLDKKTIIFFMHIVNIYKQFPFMVYKAVSTGRLTGTTKINDKKYLVLINYQGLKKVLRKEIFKGMYEYDISTAAPVILLQLFYKDYPKIKLKLIEEYIADKANKRIEFAKLLTGDLDKNIKVVKIALTALFFGANLKIRYDKLSDALRSTISELHFNKLRANSKFNELLAEVRILFKSLLKKHLKFKKDAEEKVVINALDMKKKFKRTDKNKAISFLYQGIEVKILLAIRKIHESDIALLIHDAIIVNKRLDTDELSTIAFNATGFSVVFEEEIVKN